jgi:hypothetical protein
VTSQELTLKSTAASATISMPIIINEIGANQVDNLQIAEEAKALLKEKGIPVMKVPHGYMITVPKREGSPSRHIEIDEMDAILALGQIRLLAVEDTVGDILIKVIDRLMPEHQRQFK